MTTTIEEQLADFAALGTVHDPAGSDEAVARELADTLMRQQLTFGPLARIGRLTNLLRILKLVTRIVTAERDVAAYSATSVWPYRRLSRLAGVNASTMQGWVNAGRKVVEPQQVPRETMPLNGAENSNSNSELVPIQ